MIEHHNLTICLTKPVQLATMKPFLQDIVYSVVPTPFFKKTMEEHL